MAEKVIEVNNLFKIFGKNPEEAFPLIEKGLSKEEILEKTGNTVGVNDVSFTVNKGEIFVVMGLSGSGKSTLIRCINRLMEPNRGEILIEDTDVSKLSKEELMNFRKEKFGMVFQHFGLLPYRTVQKNVEYGLEVKKVKPSTRKKRAREAIKKVGLEGWEDQKPQNLSGGMKQRVGLARALAVDPDIFLMDEPFSALDPLIKKEMQDQLLELYEEVKKTTIFITHDLNEALKVGDKIAIMKAGKIVQMGSQEEILTNAANDYVRDFVKDVDRSRVLKARDIMIKPKTLLKPDQGEGPRTAIHKMRENEISSIIVVDKDKKVMGILKIEEALKILQNKDDENLKKYIKEIPRVDPGDTMDDMFAQIAELDIPLPVVDKNDELMGIIIKSNVLSNLAPEKVI